MPPKGQKLSLSARDKISVARSIPKVDCLCLNCGTSFKTHRSEVKRGGGKFCCKQCEGDYRRGVPQSKETCLKKSLVLKGRSHSESHKINIKTGAKNRWKRNEEHERASETAKNRPPVSKATRKKMRAAQLKVQSQYDIQLRRVESLIGGFWYGNVRYWYTETPQYCEKFNKEFKERVRAFWGYQCFECGTPQNGRKLGIHHVHYDKRMCCNGSPQDVIPLCGKCHSKTNYNREYWEDYFTELLYGYCPDGKCFFTKEEMKEFQGV